MGNSQSQGQINRTLEFTLKPEDWRAEIDPEELKELDEMAGSIGVSLGEVFVSKPVKGRPRYPNVWWYTGNGDGRPAMRVTLYGLAGYTEYKIPVQVSAYGPSAVEIAIREALVYYGNNLSGRDGKSEI